MDAPGRMMLNRSVIPTKKSDGLAKAIPRKRDQWETGPEAVIIRATGRVQWLRESESAEEAIAVKGRVKLRRRAGSVVIAGVAAAVCFGLSGCLVIGYSSQGRWWVWPGSLAVTVLLVALWWLTRR